ncbi:pyocin activator PrtN family protein [Pseudomonas sp. NPDC087346]|uniref:pyocin activator PrtN family protein n=1 Tax=Pseudomonas sp. NPDC087346 TaxID=3364438 RepID=UPI0038051256
MNTLLFLMVQYDGQVIVPIDRVCADYFSHLTPEKLKSKVAAGQIDIVVVQIENSPKAARGIHIKDLADYLDAQRRTAKMEHERLMGRAPKYSRSETPIERLNHNELTEPTQQTEPFEQMTQFLRIAEVKRITSLSTSAIYKMINEGKFPKQVSLGDRAVAWIKSEVRSWIDNRPRKS